jgi:hypothetical protein
VLGRIVYQRLRRVLVPDLRRLWTRDMDARVKDLQVDARIKDLQQRLAATQSELFYLRAAHRKLALSEWNATRAPLASGLDTQLSLDRIRTHVCGAVSNAAVHTEPTTYTVIERVLPPDFYELLSRSIPPSELFPDRDPVKQDWEMEALDQAPELTRRVWSFFDDRVVREVLAPAIFARFREAVIGHYAQSGGDAFGARAADIPHAPTAGRIQLRRPGYHLRPHLDPKRVVITGLLYLARDGDSEDYGTRLFRVNGRFTHTGTKTFFPEEEGLTCEVARMVPFRANTLLAFVNSGAAHGATLPADAALDERYAFQFYIKPDDGKLKKLLQDLPDDIRATWKGLT